MVTYCYQDPTTKKVIDRSFPMGEAPDWIEVDGKEHERCFGAEFAGQGGQQASTWPMVSKALAVHPTQRKEYAEFASNNGVPTDFDVQGHPVFRTKKHRKKYAELVGATDFDGGYGDPRSD